jgi:colanic acid/amylovoran biosynthesis glycosyltransferase
MLLAQIRVLVRKPLVYASLLRLVAREREVRNQRDRLRLVYHLVAAGYVYTHLKDEGFSHIHAHMLDTPTSIALYLSRFLDIPFSFTLHGSNIYLDPLMLGTKLRMAKKVVSISHYNVAHVRGKYGDATADKIKVIRCGVDPRTFHPEPRKASTRPVILSIGRLMEIKGFPYLLEACSCLKAEGFDFSCLVVGDGKDREMLAGKAAALGLDGVVTFLGKQPQERVLQLLQEASIFVLASIITVRGGREGIPVALMEAMAMELPVVSTRTSGIPELVEDGTEGLLVEHSNAAELAGALGMLLKDAGVRERMGKRGRAKVVRDFNITQIPAQFEDIFN